MALVDYYKCLKVLREFRSCDIIKPDETGHGARIRPIGVTRG